VTVGMKSRDAFTAASASTSLRHAAFDVKWKDDLSTETTIDAFVPIFQCPTLRSLDLSKILWRSDVIAALMHTLRQSDDSPSGSLPGMLSIRGLKLHLYFGLTLDDERIGLIARKMPALETFHAELDRDALMSAVNIEQTRVPSNNDARDDEEAAGAAAHASPSSSPLPSFSSLTAFKTVLARGQSLHASISALHRFMHCAPALHTLDIDALNHPLDSFLFTNSTRVMQRLQHFTMRRSSAYAPGPTVDANARLREAQAIVRAMTCMSSLETITLVHIRYVGMLLPSIIKRFGAMKLRQINIQHSISVLIIMPPSSLLSSLLNSHPSVHMHWTIQYVGEKHTTTRTQPPSNDAASSNNSNAADTVTKPIDSNSTDGTITQCSPGSSSSSSSSSSTLPPSSSTSSQSVISSTLPSNSDATATAAALVSPPSDGSSPNRRHNDDANHGVANGSSEHANVHASTSIHCSSASTSTSTLDQPSQPQHQSQSSDHPTSVESPTAAPSASASSSEASSSSSISIGNGHRIPLPRPASPTVISRLERLITNLSVIPRTTWEINCKLQGMSDG